MICSIPNTDGDLGRGVALGGFPMTVAAVSRLLLILLALLSAGGRAAAQDASICAMVRIEIEQELTLERQAFDAHMRINNNLADRTLEEVLVEVYFTDEQGGSVTASSDPDATDAAFFIRLDSLTGIDAVDGSGSVRPGGTADIHWLIIPAPGSGGTAPDGTLYFVGANLTYRLAGEENRVEVAPDYIYVKPQPVLVLDYFLPRQVLADDPFTAAVEPVVPFTLGVRVRNNGFGTAANVQIESGQPKIVDNQQGLLIDFRITGSSLNDQPVVPALAMGFGDIGPAGAAIGRWVMETTLSGRFVEFTVDLSHADELGGRLTSLIESVRTHTLLRNVLVDLPGRDRVRDFLARVDFSEDGDLKVYESNGVDSAVLDRSPVATLLPTGGASGLYLLQTPMTTGFAYARLPDPYRGFRVLHRVLRSDGKEIAPENVWLSRTQREDQGWDYHLSLFDANTDGRYLVEFAPSATGPEPPVLQFIPDRQIEIGQQIAFLVEASDPNGTVPVISAEPLPGGASFSDESTAATAVWVFDWTPGADQEGVYDITYTASDGDLEAAQTARILVCGLGDADCDGMPDDLELLYFDTLDRDGSGDFDDDGISDLDEIRNGTDPTVGEGAVVLDLPPGMNLFAYPFLLGDDLQTCQDLRGFIGDESEVGSVSRLNPQTQQFERCDAQGGEDFALVQGEAHVVHMKARTEVVLEGEEICPEVYLEPGVNLVGHPSPPAGYGCYGWLLDHETVTAIQRFDARTGRYQTCGLRDTGQGSLEPVGVDFPILRGEGYLLHAQSSEPLSLIGCGD